MIGKGCLKEYRKERVNREAATAGPERAMGTLAEETPSGLLMGSGGSAPESMADRRNMGYRIEVLARPNNI